MICSQHFLKASFLPGETSNVSDTLASPWTRTAGGVDRPLPVGLENSKDTRGSRRILKAFCGNPIEVVIRNRPGSGAGSNSAVSGQVRGVPSFANVVNSHVRNS